MISLKAMLSISRESEQQVSTIDKIVFSLLKNLTIAYGVIVVFHLCVFFIAAVFGKAPEIFGLLLLIMFFFSGVVFFLIPTFVLVITGIAVHKKLSEKDMEPVKILALWLAFFVGVVMLEAYMLSMLISF